MTRLDELVKERKREQGSELETLHRRYLQAPPPQAGEHQSLAYRLRLLFLDRWNLWHRLTRYRTWKGPRGKPLMVPTMPVSGRLAGGSKNAIAVCGVTSVPDNAVRVSRLLAWCGNFLTTADGAMLAGLLQ